MNEIDTEKIIAVLMASDLHGKLTEDVKPSYRAVLDPMGYGIASASVAALLVTSKWLPSPAEIRTMATDLECGEVRAGGEAWGSVLKAIRGAGVYRRPGVDFKFADPVVLEAVLLFGWEELCSSENTVADRARFIELYDRIAEKSRRRETIEALPAVKRYRELQATAARALPRGETRAIADVMRAQPALAIVTERPTP